MAETQHSPNFFKSWGTSNAEPNNPPFFQAVGQRALPYHGGTISVSSEKEKGSAFLVTLPLKNSD